MRTRIALIAGLVLSTLLVATVAVAAEGDVALDGRGALVAAGVGHVELAGQGHVGLKMSGDVTIIDYAGDADVQIRSASDAAASDAGPESTTISLTGFTGVVTVTGSDFAVEATGRFRRIARQRVRNGVPPGSGLVSHRLGPPRLVDSERCPGEHPTSQLSQPEQPRTGPIWDPFCLCTLTDRWHQSLQ